MKSRIFGTEEKKMKFSHLRNFRFFFHRWSIQINNIDSQTKKKVSWESLKKFSIFSDDSLVILFFFGWIQSIEFCVCVWACRSNQFQWNPWQETKMFQTTRNLKKKIRTSISATKTGSKMFQVCVCVYRWMKIWNF